MAKRKNTATEANEEAAPSSTPRPKRRTITKQLQVQVNDEERLKKFEELAEVDREIDRVAAEKAAMASDFNTSLKAHRKHRTTLLETIGSGIETRSVECYEQIDDQLGEVQTFMVDGDVMLPEFSRPMTQDERQTGLFDNIPAPDEDPGDDGDVEFDDEVTEEE